MLKNITSNIAVPIEAVFTMVTIWSKSSGNNYIGTIGGAPIASSGPLRERETRLPYGRLLMLLYLLLL